MQPQQAAGKSIRAYFTAARLSYDCCLQYCGVVVKPDHFNLASELLTSSAFQRFPEGKLLERYSNMNLQVEAEDFMHAMSANFFART